ncbi:tetratricopeptide repeat protein [Pseudomonas aeruginosa]|uniref:tetratricopeptide repeat protein n=1 Tax=Pseudomonas aeruginosa TaxID=287 RepID=UPI003F3D0C39
MKHNETFTIISCMVPLVVLSPPPVEGNELIIYSKEGSEIYARHWNDQLKAWSEVSYKKGKIIFSLYPKPKHIEESGVTAFSLDKNSLSPAGDIILIQRVQRGELYLENGGTKATETSYCDAINMKTGCVMQTRPASYCSGTWGKNWKPSYPEYTAPSGLETTSPSDILSSIKRLKTPPDKAEAINSYIYMSIESYLSCYPLAPSNLSELNDIGFYLAEGGDTLSALRIYRKLEKAYPSRVVLKLNIADALWETENKAEAGPYYKKYRAGMKEHGLLKKIPARVDERIKYLSHK